MTNASRRSFLRNAVLGSVSVAGASLALPAQACYSTKIPEKWDEEVDVLIVGSGFAGLAAGIEAQKAGAKTLVIDKMPTPGGNSIINGGCIAATGCPQQKRRGIEDSIDLLEKDVLVAGLYLNDPKKVRYMAEQVYKTYEWTVNELGVEYDPEFIGQEGGHTVPRYVTTTNGSGSGIVQKEMDMYKKLGGRIRLRTYVEHIVQDDNGRVIGLQVRQGYRFPKADSGKVKFIRAKKGVVMCYGGFAADAKYRLRQDPKLSDKFDCTNQPGATAELWRETAAIGAMQVQNDWIQCGPWGNPNERGMGIGWLFNQMAAAEYGMWVNTDGKRFVNELANRKVRADAIMLEHLQNKRCYAISTEPNMQNLSKSRPGIIDKMLERKLIQKFDSLDAMAQALSINVKELKAQLRRFNGFVKNQEDPEFKRLMNKEQVALQAPFYVGEVQPKIHHCMGGLVTDEKCRVLDVRTEQPIEGLYAAGEATSGVHGAVRLGSVAILDCLVFGRLAGQCVVA